MSKIKSGSYDFIDVTKPPYDNVYGIVMLKIDNEKLFVPNPVEYRFQMYIFSQYGWYVGRIDSFVHLN